MVHTRRPWERAPLFSWAVSTPDEQRGACGVASDQGHAVRDVIQALHVLAGTHGVIQICWLSWLGSYYEYGSVVARAEIDEATGAVVWRDELPGDLPADGVQPWV